MAHTRSPRNSPVLGLSVQGDIGPLTYYTSRRQLTVAFLRAPPLNPPSILQETIRERFREAARQWRRLTKNQKAAYRRASHKCNLSLTGYNLFTWYYCTRDYDRVRTIERQSGETLAAPSF